MGWPVPALHNYLHLQARRAGAQSTKFTASCGVAWDDCFSTRASTVTLLTASARERPQSPSGSALSTTDHARGELIGVWNVSPSPG